MRARALMVLGTGSHVGKSLLVTALCRIFHQQSIRVAPFKSQNMSLNSAATVDGLEIGRAQALQAEAAGVAASVDMNPILLKPCGNMTSQIVVRGQIWGTLSASDYHKRRVEELMPVIRRSYESLAQTYDVIVLEGAGSPAEINLKQHDIVNMRMADLADAQCLLVGDIDRGGVFAALLGTVQLLEPHEQARIGGFCINKFRGDVALLEPGVRMMEERLGKSSLGVVPYLHGLSLEEEDSLGLPDPEKTAWSIDHASDRALRIAVVALPSFSNFTDFDALRSEPSVSLHFCRTEEQLRNADAIILPGSKQTVDDLLWLRAQGLDKAITCYAATGLVVGICGGMQMLGEQIADPLGVEHAGTVPGLGLLPIRTSMQAAKVTSLAHGTLTATSLFHRPIPPVPLAGYEIHVGETSYLPGAGHFATIGRTDAPGPTHRDGCVSSDGQTFGTYLHGIFDQDEFRHLFITSARAFHRLTEVRALQNWKKKREASIDHLAAEVSKALDMPTLFSWVGQTYSGSPYPDAANIRGASL